MESHLTIAITAVPNVIIDLWMPMLDLSQLRLVLYLLRNGHERPPGLSGHERFQAAAAVGVLPRSIYAILRRMTAAGLVITERHDRTLYYRLNLEWRP